MINSILDKQLIRWWEHPHMFSRHIRVQKGSSFGSKIFTMRILPFFIRKASKSNVLPESCWSFSNSTDVSEYSATFLLLSDRLSTGLILV
jgi:hypothetical protein